MIATDAFMTAAGARDSVSALGVSVAIGRSRCAPSLRHRCAGADSRGGATSALVSQR